MGIDGHGNHTTSSYANNGQHNMKNCPLHLRVRSIVTLVLFILPAKREKKAEQAASLACWPSLAATTACMTTAMKEENTNKMMEKGKNTRLTSKIMWRKTYWQGRPWHERH